MKGGRRQTGQAGEATRGPASESVAQADDAGKARHIFLANISHELRTPLNGLIGMAELLEDTALTMDQRVMVEVMRESGETLSRRLSDVLDQAEISSGQITLRSEPFALGGAIRSAVGRTKQAAVRKGIDFRMRLEPAVERTVVGDSARLQQIVASLVDNAVKFTDSGAVCLSVSIDDAVCRITVTDTGIGIHPMAQASIFDCFRQGDGSPTRSHDGLGLGLALARQLADLIGARLECRSVPGQGSAFVLTLPVVCAAPPARAYEPTRPTGRDLKEGERAVVLVVDDHQVNRELLKLTLTPSGARVVTAENGAEACDLWTSHRFDLVIMDLHMPVMDGLTAIRRIRAMEASSACGRTPMVVFTANATSEQEKASQQAGADYFLTKPLAPSALMATFMTILYPSRSNPLSVLEGAR